MKMIGFGLYPVTLLLSLMGTMPARPAYVDYYNYAPSLATREEVGYARISVPNEDGLSWFVNTPRKTQYCSADSPVRCAKIGTLILAAPAGKMSVGDNWTLDEREFRVVSAGKVSLLGKIIPYFVVESTKKDDLYRYFFNEDIGVVALVWPSRVRDQPGEWFLLGAARGVLSQ